MKLKTARSCQHGYASIWNHQRMCFIQLQQQNNRLTKRIYTNNVSD